jgi:trafficking protein particle complex subunit 2
MLEFSFLINSCLDIFEIRQNNKSIDQDLGLLQAVNERLAMYGWLTNTGVKFIIVVDMAGRPINQEGEKKKNAPIVGLRDADLKPVSTTSLSVCRGYFLSLTRILTKSYSLQAFRALQTAYIQLLQNPFYNPDDHNPLALVNGHGTKSLRITNKRFINEVKRVGETWAPGVPTI